MGHIIAIESATKVCSVALYGEDCELIDAIEQDGNYSHSENIAEFVNQLLMRQNLQQSDLSAVAISKGPGSYTGLRIGVAFAKGLCYALSIPMIAINTLEALAYKAKKERKISEGYIVPMIDARRLEVYNSVYDGELNLIEDIQANVLTEDSFSQYLAVSKVHCIGDGSTKVTDVIQHENLVVHEDCVLSARFFGPQIKKALEQSKFEDLAYFEPFYLKDFIAIKGKPLL